MANSQENNEHIGEVLKENEIKDINDKERIEAELVRRAENLARPIDEGDDESKFIDIIKFALGDETYGIQDVFVCQVSYLGEYTKLSSSLPSHIVGITSFREKIISLVDIGAFFDMHLKEDTDGKKILILKSNKTEFAIIIDEVYGKESVSIDTIQYSLATLRDARAKYFYGITDDHVIILDGAKILSDDEILIK
jgi:chemotaxis signal transduction protein